MKDPDSKLECTACDQGKMNRKKFNLFIANRSDRPGEVIYSDLCGKISPPTLHNEKYVIHFLDEKSGFIMCFLTSKKDAAFSCFKRVRARLSNLTGSNVKYFATDGGGEYIGTDFKEFLDKKGIIHAKSPPNTPERVGKSERLNKILFDHARAML